jgi:hypothetical protein
MASSNVYDRFDAKPANKKDWGETAQIAVLSVIILVFFAISASSAIGLLRSALTR